MADDFDLGGFNLFAPDTSQAIQTPTFGQSYPSPAPFSFGVPALNVDLPTGMNPVTFGQSFGQQSPYSFGPEQGGALPSGAGSPQSKAGGLSIETLMKVLGAGGNVLSLIAPFLSKGAQQSGLPMSDFQFGGATPQTPPVRRGAGQGEDMTSMADLGAGQAPQFFSSRRQGSGPLDLAASKAFEDYLQSIRSGGGF